MHQPPEERLVDKFSHLVRDVVGVLVKQRLSQETCTKLGGVLGVHKKPDSQLKREFSAHWPHHSNLFVQHAYLRTADS